MNRILYLFMAAIIILISASGCTEEHNETHERTTEIVDNNGNVEMKELTVGLKFILILLLFHAQMHGGYVFQSS